MSETDKHRQLMMRAAIASILVALLLFSLKGVAYWRSDSISILGSMTDSGMDFFASLVSLMALRAAFKRPDKETCPAILNVQAKAGYVVAGLFFVASGYLAYLAFWQIFEPVPLEHGFMGVAVSVFAILASLSILAYQQNVVDKTDSATIQANRMHFMADILSNIAVILGLLLATGAEIYEADGFFGLGIAAYVAFSAFMLVLHSRDLQNKSKEG